MRKRLFFIATIVLVSTGLMLFVQRFYPQQQMPVGVAIDVQTPQPEKYHDDCLHPCIRQLGDSLYAMVQSPYYAGDNKVENPILYVSNSYSSWKNGFLIDDTPEIGYNSDPNIFIENNKTYVFWRRYGSPECKEIVYGRHVTDTAADKSNCPPLLTPYISSDYENISYTQCPILIKKNGRYLFYAAWHQYHPRRKNKGMAIWDGTSLDKPNFKLTDTIPFHNPLVCDKLFQIKIIGKIFYLPKPKRYDLWHFDLFEYGDKLFMVSCGEKDDNIMLSVSDDWKHFKTSRTPLLNNHCSENYTGYRQYYYKPTAFVKNDSLYLFYTANDEKNPKRNRLYLSRAAMKELKY